ncbi:MAG: bifunctional oligoribonuclease/PAP phosphatase NrnA [Proteobacteria bacterium]|nr:bifunctional oligoribonuclease/PAP phosphatase NrnA [Pseudomonadota bacterium]
MGKKTINNGSSGAGSKNIAQPPVKAASSIAEVARAKNEMAMIALQQRAEKMIGHAEKNRPRFAELEGVLEHAKGKSLLICIKGYPDPDNIASALALQWMAKQFEIRTRIIHFEEISHYENRALVKKLDLEIEEFESAGIDLSDWEYYAVNDAQSPELPIKMPPNCQLLVFVDHHKSLGTVQASFLDIREQSGSTSAMYAEYLSDGTLPFEGTTNEQSKIATALMHGIRTDTDNFANAMPMDYKASEFLSRFMDKDLLHLISRQSIPAKTMDLTQIALQRKDIRGTFMFAGVGFVRDEDRDGIGQCADYLLHREGIDTVIVYGIVGNEIIDGSLRTRSHTLDPDKWIKDVFGQDQNGQYYGGGRKDKGGFQIPLGVFANCSDKELLWILIKKTIDELFYDKIGVDGKPGTSHDEIQSNKV